MNEMWASEVERKLRAISDRLGSLNQNALRLEGQLNFGLPTTTPPDGADVEEVHWIRLTGKAVIAGVNTYAWRRQVYVMTGGGMSWVDSGEFGTIAENPAIGLNNEDRPVEDGQRYPAKFNPDTAQWVFFYNSPASGGGGSFRWATKYCFKVIFDTEPTLNVATSLNPTKDGAALAAAIEALEAPTPAIAFIMEYEPEFRNNLVFNHQYHPGSGPAWQFIYVFGQYRPSNLVSYHFQCGYFPGSNALELDSGPETITDKYVPCVMRRDLRTDENDDYDNIGAGLTYIEENLWIQPGTARAFNDFNLTKRVRYPFYSASGLRIGYRWLKYTRKIIDGEVYNEPYTFTYGPKYGTSGYYQFPAAIVEDSAPDAVSGLSSFGVADIYVSWGSTCEEEAGLPVTDDEPEDWSDLCQAITSASGSWNEIPGLIIKLNGTALTSNPNDGVFTFGFSDPPTLSFEIEARLQQYLDQNPDVSITYSFTRLCTPPPANPATTTGTIVNGTSITPARNGACPSKDTNVLLDIKLEASPSRNLFTSECCTPFGTHCGTTVLETDQLSYDIDSA